MKTILIFFFRLYQMTISPLLGKHCRFYPSCSNYAIEAVSRHGWWRGLWLAGKRLLKCQPLCPGGYDPVPDNLRAATRNKA